MLDLFQADARPRAHRLPPGLERVVLALAGPLEPGHLAWLRTHLSALPPPLRLEVVTLGARRAWTGLRALERALEQPLAARPVGAGLDELERAPGCLLVALGPIDRRSGPVDWALRRARGPVLVVPGPATAPSPWPHVEVAARDASEVERLAPWAALLPPGASVTLRAPGPLPSESPARSLAEVMVLQRTLRAACERLSDLGVLARAARAFDAALDPNATLVVRVARRGLLRRWWLTNNEVRRLRRTCHPVLLAP